MNYAVMYEYAVDKNSGQFGLAGWRRHVAAAVN
jgi:hypothetical protein